MEFFEFELEGGKKVLSNDPFLMIKLWAVKIAIVLFIIIPIGVANSFLHEITLPPELTMEKVVRVDNCTLWAPFEPDLNLYTGKDRKKFNYSGALAVYSPHKITPISNNEYKYKELIAVQLPSAYFAWTYKNCADNGSVIPEEDYKENWVFLKLKEMSYDAPHLHSVNTIMVRINTLLEEEGFIEINLN